MMRTKGLTWVSITLSSVTAVGFSSIWVPAAGATDDLWQIVVVGGNPPVIISSGNWSDPTHWSLGGRPGFGDVGVLPTLGFGPYAVTLDIDLELNLGVRLESSDANLNALNKTFTVRDDPTDVDGNVIITAGTLTLESSTLTINNDVNGGGLDCCRCRTGCS